MRALLAALALSLGLAGPAAAQLGLNGGSLGGSQPAPLSIPPASGGGAGTVTVTAAQMSGDGSGSSPILLKSSSVTLQGNAFNGVSQLLLLDGSGRYPQLDGTLILRVSSVAAASVGLAQLNSTLTTDGLLKPSIGGSGIGGCSGSTYKIWTSLATNAVNCIGGTNGQIPIASDSGGIAFATLGTSAAFSLTAGVNTLSLAADPSSTTLQGNTFNGASQLTKLDSTSRLIIPSAIGGLFIGTGPITGLGQLAIGAALDLTLWDTHAVGINTQARYSPSAVLDVRMNAAQQLTGNMLMLIGTSAANGSIQATMQNTTASGAQMWAFNDAASGVYGNQDAGMLWQNATNNITGAFSGNQLLIFTGFGNVAAGRIWLTAGSTTKGLLVNTDGTLSYMTSTDYTNKAVCYVNSAGKLGHCTTADASNCGCTAN